MVPVRLSCWRNHEPKKTTSFANGSLQKLQITDNLVSPAVNQTCNYTHDDLGRILTANCGAVQNQSFSYDPFSNIKKTAISGVGNFLVNYDQTTNRVQDAAYSYDNNGCLLNVGTGGRYQYTWDAEGKMVSVTAAGSTVSLTYDAMGRMVEQQRGTSYTQVVYGPGGGKLALMSGQTLSKAFVPLPGGATAVYTSAGLAYYRHTDWLGSSRLASTPTRTVYYDGALAAFGENYGGTGSSDLSFTGQNQDTVSGLYDFMFRRYSPGQGRWISPDPAGRAAVSMTNPQSWNRYGYVGNTPLTAIDPLGLDLIKVGYGGSTTVYGGGDGFDITFAGGGSGGGGFGRGDIELLLAADGGGDGSGDFTPAVNLKALTNCLSKYGTVNAKNYMSPGDYAAAVQAATAVGIATSDVLAIWDNETSFNVDNYWVEQGSGDIGPLQVTPSGRDDLARKHILPDNYDSDFDANLLAGARYYNMILNTYHVPVASAAAVYQGGIGNYQKHKIHKRAKTYQANFNEKKSQFDTMIGCLNGGK